MNICRWIKSILGCKQDLPTDDNTKANAFIKTWSVVEFAKKNGKMQICKAPDKNNRESYLKCRFVKPNSTVYVTVSSRMQNITADEISKNKDRIKIGMLPNGKYVLFDFRWKDWEEVNLGL